MTRTHAKAARFFETLAYASSGKKDSIADLARARKGENEKRAAKAEEPGQNVSGLVVKAIGKE